MTPLELQIQTLPDNPGVYQYDDKDNKILYVGKAKNLKKRVQSYFTKNHDNYKTSVLVKKIVTIKHIVVPTETDALLLENNLIKTLQPRYNVLIKLFSNNNASVSVGTTMCLMVTIFFTSTEVL